MNGGINAQCRQRLQIQILKVLWGGLHDDLELVVLLQTVRVLSVTPVRRTAAGLHVGSAPAFRPYCAQEGRWVECPRTDFHIQRLQHNAALLCPELLKFEDQLLKCKSFAFGLCHRFAHHVAAKSWLLYSLF